MIKRVCLIMILFAWAGVAQALCRDREDLRRQGGLNQEEG